MQIFVIDFRANSELYRLKDRSLATTHKISFRYWNRLMCKLAVFGVIQVFTEFSHGQKRSRKTYMLFLTVPQLVYSRHLYWSVRVTSGAQHYDFYQAHVSWMIGTHVNWMIGTHVSWTIGSHVSWMIGTHVNWTIGIHVSWMIVTEMWNTGSRSEYPHDAGLA